MKRQFDSEDKQFCGRVRVAHVLSFFMLPYYVYLRSESHLVMYVTIAVKKRCSVSLYLQLCVGGLMSYLHYLCLLGHSNVQHILCCVFVFIFFHCFLV